MKNMASPVYKDGLSQCSSQLHHYFARKTFSGTSQLMLQNQKVRWHFVKKQQRNSSFMEWCKFFINSLRITHDAWCICIY